MMMRCLSVPAPLSAHPYPFVISTLANEGQDVLCGAGLDRDNAMLRGGRMDTSNKKYIQHHPSRLVFAKFNNHSAITATKKPMFPLRRRFESDRHAC